MEIVTSHAIGILTDLSNWLGDNVKPGGPLSLKTLRRIRDDAVAGTTPVEAGGVGTLPRLIVRAPGRSLVGSPLPQPVYVPGRELEMVLPDDWSLGQAWQVWDLLDQTLTQLEPALQRARTRAKKTTEQCHEKRALPQRDAGRIRVTSADGTVVASIREDRQ